MRVLTGLLLLAATGWASGECPFCGRPMVSVTLPGSAATRHLCRYCPGVVHVYEDGRTLCSYRDNGRRDSFLLAGDRVVACPGRIATQATLRPMGPGTVVLPPSPPVAASREPLHRPRPPIELPDAPVSPPAHAVRMPGRTVTLPGFAVTMPAPPVGRPAPPIGRPAAPVARPAPPAGTPTPPVERATPPVPALRVVVCGPSPESD
ncbi:MAG: hypothetical protein ACT4PV_08565 [Planctomycetaceae bacterium]